MIESKPKMYSERKGNIAVFRGCDFSCSYCAFRTSLRRSSCQQCRDFVPHSHMEVLRKNPPRTKEGEFITIGLTGDISFMSMDNFYHVIEYCRKWKDRIFLIQSKKPAYFLLFQDFLKKFPDNVIIGTTIETNRKYIWDARTAPRLLTTDYSDISKAPIPELRMNAMKHINYKKEITIEPIMSFDLEIMVEWMNAIKPEFIYIGYNSRNNIILPEPTLAETRELVQRLRDDGHDVREKLMRKEWYE